MSKVQSERAFRRREATKATTHVIACRKCGLGSTRLPTERKGYVLPVSPLHFVELLSDGTKAYEHERCPPKTYWNKDSSA